MKGGTPRLVKFVSPIPMGMRIYAYDVELVVPDDCNRAAKRFARRKGKRIYLEHNPNRKQESDAIRVIGKSRGWLFEQSKCIGYVPVDIASRIETGNIEDRLKARLHLISTGGRERVTIRFNLLGPQDDYSGFSS